MISKLATKIQLFFRISIRIHPKTVYSLISNPYSPTASPPLSFPQYSVHLHPSPTDHWAGTNHA